MGNADPVPPPAPCERRVQRLAQLRAAAAMRGFAIVPVGSGFVVGRWGLMRELANVAELERFLALAGVPAPAIAGGFTS
jgi:hypothetical protein